MSKCEHYFTNKKQLLVNVLRNIMNLNQIYSLYRRILSDVLSVIINIVWLIYILSELEIIDFDFKNSTKDLSNNFNLNSHIIYYQLLKLQFFSYYYLLL